MVKSFRGDQAACADGKVPIGAYGGQAAAQAIVEKLHAKGFADAEVRQVLPEGQEHWQGQGWQGISSPYRVYVLAATAQVLRDCGFNTES